MTKRPQLIENLEQAWAGNLETLLDQYVEDCIFEDKAFGLVHRGHVGLREVFDFTYKMMPDFRVTYGDQIVGASFGAVQWVFTGSFNGDFEGTTHAGTPLRIEGVSFMKLRDGRIAHNIDYWNLAALAQQLGKGKAP